MAQQGYATCLVAEDGRQITQFTRFPATRCVIDGTDYLLARESPSARYTLEGPLGVAAVAYWSGQREITIDSTSHPLVLRRMTWLGRRWEVHGLGQRVGTCRVRTFSAASDLPVELPLPLRVFTLYTVVMASAGSPLHFLPWF